MSVLHLGLTEDHIRDVDCECVPEVNQLDADTLTVTHRPILRESVRVRPRPWSHVMPWRRRGAEQ